MRQESIQPMVQLRTAALAGYGTPRPAEVAAPPKPQRRSLGTVTWVVLLIFAFGLMQYTFRKSPAPEISAATVAGPANAVPPAPGARNDPAKEIADRSAQVPTKVDPVLLNAGAKVYLSDLQEFAWAGPSDWSFGKAGRIGN